MMTYLAATDQAGVFSNHDALYASEAVRLGNGFLSCWTRAHVPVLVRLSRAQYVMAHLGVMEQAGVLLNHHAPWTGAIVCQLGDRGVFRWTGVHFVAEKEQWSTKAGRHNHHSVALTTDVVNDVPCLLEGIKHLWDWVRGASKSVHKYVVLVRRPGESVHEFVAAHFRYLLIDEPAVPAQVGLKRIITSIK
jgi:hypothetical protein